MFLSIRPLLRSIIFLCLFSLAFTLPALSQNGIQNGEFDNGTTSWTFQENTGPNYSNGGGSISVVQGAGMSGTNALRVDVANTNNDTWVLALKQNLSFNLQLGKPPTTDKIPFHGRFFNCKF